MVSTVPTANATGVAVDSTVQLVFSEPLEASTVNATNVTIANATAAVTYESSSNSIILTVSGQTQNQTSVVTVSTGVTDVAGNGLAQAFTLSYTTAADTTAPTVSSTTPTNGASGVARSATISVVFSEAMAASTINASTVFLQGITSTVAYDPSTRTATLSPTGMLPNAALVTAQVTAGVTDAAGNALGASYLFSFTTLDDVPPTVASTTPANGDTNVARNSTVSVVFSEAMNAATIGSASVLLDGITSTVAYNPGTRTATLTPSALLPSGAAVTGRVKTSVTDAAGNALAAEHVFTFTTIDNVAPTVVSTNPANGATNVPRTSTVTVVFSEPMDASTITSTNVVLDGLTGAVTYSSATNTATLTPSAQLPNGSTVTGRVKTGVKDVAGNSLAAEYVFTFTTVTTDTTPPTVVSTLPANLTYNVDRSVVVKVTFSELMDPTSLTPSTIYIAGLPGTVSWDAATKTASLSFASQLPNNTNLVVTVTTGVLDASGNSMASQYTFAFKTKDSGPPYVSSSTPYDGATGWGRSTPLYIGFNETLEPTTVTSANFFCDGVATTVTFDPNFGSNTATLSPAAGQWPNGTTLSCHVTTGIRDLDGMASAAQYNLSFTTVDTVAPVIVSTNPANNGSGAPVGGPFSVTFDEAMSATSINSSSFLVVGQPAGTVTYDNVTKTASWTPSSGLANNTLYTARVTTAVRDVSGNALAATYQWTFTTETDTTPPTITSTVPANGATGVAITTSNIRVNFSENMNASTVNASNFTCTQTYGGTTTTQAGTVAYVAGSPAYAAFTPTGGFAYGTVYSCTLGTAMTDVAGNALAAPYTFSFTTQPDTFPPTVTSSNPANYGHFVAAAAVLTVTFSEAMDASTINATNLTVNGVTGTVSYNSATRTATFTPSAPLALGAGYTLTVSGVKDLAGNALAAPYTAEFRTLTGPSRISEDTRPLFTTLKTVETSNGVMLLGTAQNGGGTNVLRLQWAYFSGGAWTSGDLGQYSSSSSAALDAVAFAGNKVVVVWTETSTVASARVFDGTAWSATAYPGSGYGALAANATSVCATWAAASGVMGSIFNGTSWSTPVLVGTAGGGGVYAITRTAATATQFMTSYYGYNSTTSLYELYAAVYSGGSWSPETLLTTLTPAGVDRSAVATNGTGFALAYAQGSAFSLHVYSGGSWATSAVPLSGGQFGSLAMASNGTGYGLTFFHNNAGLTAYGMIYSGGSWGTPTSLGTISLYARIVSDGSGYLVALDSFTGMRAHQYSGGSWSSTPLTSATGAVTGLSSNAGRYAVTWTSASQAFAAIYNLGWQPAVRLDTGTQAAALNVANVGTSFLTAFNDSGTPTARLSAAGSSTFGAPAEIPTGLLSGLVSEGSLALAPDGKALATWLQYERNVANVFGRYFDGAAWQPVFRITTNATNVTLPRVATNGTRWVISYKDATDRPRARSWTPAGGVTAEVALGTTAAGTVDVASSTANGSFVIAWNEGSALTSSFSADGLTWSAKQVIDSTGSGGGGSRLKLMANDSGYYVSYAGAVNLSSATTNWKARNGVLVSPSNWSTSPINHLGQCLTYASISSGIGGVCRQTSGNGYVNGFVDASWTYFGAYTSSSFMLAAGGPNGTYRVAYYSYLRDYQGGWQSTFNLTATVSPQAFASDGKSWIGLNYKNSAGYDYIFEHPTTGFSVVAPFDADNLSTYSPTVYGGRGEVGALYYKSQAAGTQVDLWGAVF